MGWEPAEVTTYEYDGEGRLVQSVTVREPEFDDDERALMVASKRRVVGSHGIPMDEATDPANQFEFVGDAVPLVDYAEKAREDSRDRYYKQYDSKDNPVNRNGHLWGVKRRSVLEADEGLNPGDE